MKINSIKFRSRKEYINIPYISNNPKLYVPKSHYQIVDVDFEIGNRQFIYSFAVFSEDFLDALPKIKKEVGNYLIHQLFENYDAMQKLKQ